MIRKSIMYCMKKEIKKIKIHCFLVPRTEVGQLVNALLNALAKLYKAWPNTCYAITEEEGRNVAQITRSNYS